MTARDRLCEDYDHLVFHKYPVAWFKNDQLDISRSKIITTTFQAKRKSCIEGLEIHFVTARVRLNEDHHHLVFHKYPVA